MKYVLSGAAVVAMLAAPAAAEMRYDHKLEQAAMAIIADRIGDIRGGFSYAQKVQLVVRQDEAQGAAAGTGQRLTDGEETERRPGPPSSVRVF